MKLAGQVDSVPAFVLPCFDAIRTHPQLLRAIRERAENLAEGVRTLCRAHEVEGFDGAKRARERRGFVYIMGMVGNLIQQSGVLLVWTRSR